MVEADFIKLDVQGGELAVLQGAQRVLSQCIGVEAEVEFSSMYVGQPLFGEVCDFLNESGLSFIDFVSINRWGRYDYDGYGQAVFGDALFLRSPEEFSAITDDVAKHIRYMSVCTLYNRFDLIEKLIEVRSGEAFPDVVLSAIAELRQGFDKARRHAVRSGRVMSSRYGAGFSLHMLY